MAEAFCKVLLDNLSSLMKREIGLILGVDKEMKKLHSIFTAIQAVLADAEDKQFEDEQMRNWLRKLNDLAYEIDDILDECAIEVSKSEKKNNKFSWKKILVSRKIGRKMKEMTEKLNDVAAERNNFHLREIPIDRQTKVAARRGQRETCSVLNEPHDVYGRDEEKEKIVDILVNHVKDCQQLSVLPIIGLGGLGKTTLAQLVYNNQHIKEHFDPKLWVCVSEDFDLKTLVKAMIESATGRGSASDLMHLDALVRRLQELLNQKRCLLILDDVWNEDQHQWDVLKNILACGSRGASIVVTTRQKKVADIMRTLPAHSLTGLSEENCWLLFKQRAFVPGEQVEELTNLEAIGRQIVKKCAGVPLAAKALGGLLRFKRKEKEWVYVKESEIWKLEQEETSILPSLRLSYHHLPPVLRRCFAYCALFPKDMIIDKKKLIFFWMAHGCISSNGIQEVEDVGDDAWNELVLRSLFQEVTYEKWGTTCKMHDLVHDLALSIMENQVPGAHAYNSPTASNSKIRQVHLSERSMTFPTSIQSQVSTLSSLMSFTRVRMLTASAGNADVLLSSIGKLKHLRSLDLSHSSIHTLPNTICSIWNLQILNLNFCFKFVRLPKNTRFMNNLRHIFLEGCASLIEMPSRIGELTSLKTLSLFIVGDKIGNQLSELERLNLGGKLEIQHLERVKNHMEAKKANLVAKPDLRDLVLKWKRDDASDLREMMDDEMVLEALEPHPNIETLEIRGFHGRSFPLWMRNSTMANVIEIGIYDCPNCLHLPPLGDLPRLRKLRLESLGMIEFIMEVEVQGGYPFPSLEELELMSLPNLKGLLKEEVRKMFPNLQKLNISDCPLLRLPPLPSLKNLTVFECSQLTLSSFSRLDNLTSLHLRFGKNTTTSIPTEALETLSNLEKLRIWNVDEHCLAAEGLRCLKSLKSLEIGMRETVTSIPEEWLLHLTALERLDISGGSDLVEVPEGIKYLHSLKRLFIEDLPKLVCLPEGLQHLHSLQYLELFDLKELTSLPDWLDKLISLQSMRIWRCPGIASLPSTIQGMTNLQSLEIWECPILKQRCEKGKGEDWHSVAHIPNLDIA